MAANDTTPLSPARSVWTRRRLVLALLVGLHFGAVLVSGLPPEAGMAWRRPLLGLSLPVLLADTHPARPRATLLIRPILDTWLQLSGQSQQWKVFTPRFERTGGLVLEGPDGHGGVQRIALATAAPGIGLRRTPWKLFELTLAAPEFREAHLPAAVPALWRRLAGERPGRVVVRESFLLLPLLDERAPPERRFAGAAAWRAQLADPALRSERVLAIVDVPPLEPAR